MTLLPEIEQLDNDRRAGGTYEDDVPWRFVAHTTEAIPSTLAGARAMAERHPYPPHLWAWPEHDWVAQTVTLDRSAFALLHPAGTPATNKMRALQVELIGHAADSPLKPAEWWAWIGQRVLRPIIDAGYAINLANVAPTTGPDGYGTSGAVRMSRAAWRTFDGVCCHANVPDNSHWDIGAGRLDLIAAAAQLEDAMALTPEQDELLHKIGGALLGERSPLKTILDFSRFVGPSYLRSIAAAVEASDVDEAEVARLVLEGLTAAKLTDAQVAAIVDAIEALPPAVADELDRRARDRLGP